MFGVLRELLAWFSPFHHAVHDVLVGIQLARTYSIVLHDLDLNSRHQIWTPIVQHYHVQIGVARKAC